jgi:hypothetical protein
MNRRNVVFMMNLLQDVNIIRPLAHLAAREMDVVVAFLVSDRFYIRDKQGVWRAEIEDMAQDLGAEIFVYDNELTAFQWLQPRHGALVAASESNLSAHYEVHNVFRVAPPGFVRITLQHGFECVGFLQNREHDKAHGRNVGFGSDLVGGWLPVDRMASMAPSERSKLVVTGPGAVLQPAPSTGRPDRCEGLVCENLHSVRMNASGDFKADFMEIFFAFCEQLADDDVSVALRPHPGGQYVLKNKVALPGNVTLANAPMYRTDLTAYRYGVSAPSSVVIDMVLAGIPTAVWRDADGVMDASNYDGLTMISTLEDWLAFRRDALIRPEMILERQRLFLRGLRMPFEADDVSARFIALLESASRRSGTPAPLLAGSRGAGNS